MYLSFKIEKFLAGAKFDEQLLEHKPILLFQDVSTKKFFSKLQTLHLSSSSPLKHM